MSDVIQFPGTTVGPVPVASVLEAGQGADEVLLIAIKDGQMTIAASGGGDPYVAIGMMEDAKYRLLGML